MDNFIKKIFDGKGDEFVHNQFIKFSKGFFNQKAMIRASHSKENYVITTTYEYAKEIVMYLAEKLGDKKVLVEGALISALDLTGFEYKERKMAMGVRKYIIESEMSGTKILELCKKIDKAFFALSFKFDETELTIQPKSPKSAKGASSAKKDDEKAKIDFIKIKTKDNDLARNLIFDKEVSDFKKIEIKHDFEITEIVLPKGESDPAKLRELAKRKGKLIRYINLDGKEIKKEINFEA